MILGKPPPDESEAVTNLPPKCSKCGGDTKEGYIPDDAGRSGYSTPFWVAGKPEFGFFGLKVYDRERHAIRTFRCIKCGFLEFYAINSA